MWVTGKDAWYFANYDPRMKREGIHHVVVERDDKYMSDFNEMVPEFISKMDESLAEIGFTFGGAVEMKHYRDAITVGKVKCMYSVLHRGWLMPSGEVVRNPLKAQRLAEELDTKRGAR